MLTLIIIMFFSMLFYYLTKLPLMNLHLSSFSLFECGFESNSGVGTYSLQFFTLALSFIAFDYEIFLLLPFMGYLTYYNFGAMVFLLILSLLTALLGNEMKFLLVT
uniref:NADH-ubiquinone oxidoreductase chain 3 n=1 Tax=Thetys vagina TaxID=942565 RepID=A0AA86IKI2_9UROC|nr:NADH dehydrogenase subunit 3 [Thetys vagina]